MTEQMRVLVIEDDLMNINAAKAMLADYDLTIVTGYDAARAAITCRFDEAKAKERINALLSDDFCCLYVNYYGRNGAEFYIQDNNTGKHINKTDWPQGVAAAAVEAENYGRPQGFDVVLTDVMIPKGGEECMSPQGNELARRQGPMPYGPVLALHAIQMGVKRIGILTQGSHHDDPFIFAFDNLTGFEAGDIRVVASNCMDALVHSDTYQEFQVGETVQNSVEVKNWKKLIEKVLA